jgi:hypothetical protein
MIAKFTGTEDKKFTITNGGHTDSIGPESFARWLECLELFVAKRTPQRGVGVPLILDFVAGGIFKVDSLEIPESRFDPDMPYEEALAFWRETPDVLVLMENGGYPEYPGYPYSTFQIELETWPTPHENLTLYLESADPSGDAGATLEGGMTPEDLPTSLALPETGPSAPASEEFLYDTSFSKVQTLDGADGGPWDALPGWNWQEATPGTNLKFTTAPLEEPLLLAGSAAANLYVHASVADVDLQVTLSEVRSDGCEVYIQNGWLRTSRRKLDAEQSTTTRPVSTHFEEDAADLPADEFTLVPVEIFPFAYYLRAGSSIRMEISAPGRTRPEWQWDALEYEDEVVVKIAVDGTSHLTLPEVISVTSMTMPPETLPACPGLRGMPTRQAQ